MRTRNRVRIYGDAEYVYEHAKWFLAFTHAHSLQRACAGDSMLPQLSRLVAFECGQWMCLSFACVPVRALHLIRCIHIILY